MKIEMDDEQYGVVEEYAQSAGVSVVTCLLNAVDDWIRTVVAVSQKPGTNVICFPGPAQLMDEPKRWVN